MSHTLHVGHARLVLLENGSIEELRDERTGLCVRPLRGASWPFAASIQDGQIAAVCD